MTLSGVKNVLKSCTIIFLLALKISGNQALSSPPNLLREASGRSQQHDHDLNNSNNIPTTLSHRRQFLSSATAFGTSSLLVLLGSSVANPAPAFAAQTTGEAIRRSAANLPGYGQADIFYPSFFQGKWKVEREILAGSAALLSGTDPLLSQLISGMTNDTPVTVSYLARFITVDGDDSTSSTSSNSFVVADRQFNEMSFYNAVRDQLLEKNNNNSAPMIRSSTWSPSNPNVYTALYNNGASKEIKVTKRATDIADVESGSVSSSEFRRITAVGTSGGGVGGIPSISASRVLTKWRKGNLDGNILEAIEVVYSEGNVGDPMMMTAGAASKPQLTLKSRLRLERVEDN